MAKSTLKPHQTALTGAVVVAALAYLIPPIHLIFLPLQYLNTHIHELCHALMAVATGGQVDNIQVHADGSGVTGIYGGNNFLTNSAGYLGATFVGSAMLFFGRTPGKARAALGLMAVALALSTALWVRGDAIGLPVGIAWMVALGASAWFLRGMTALFVCQLVALEQCLNSVGSVYDLLKISVYTERFSDAQNMQNLTYVPAAVWALGWSAISLALVGLTVRRAWNFEPNPRSAASPKSDR